MGGGNGCYGIQASSTERTTLQTKMNTTQARQRYLDKLVNNHDDLDSDEDNRACILCRCDFTRGYITQWYATLFFSLNSVWADLLSVDDSAHVFCEVNLPCYVVENLCSLTSRGVWEPGSYEKRVKHALSVGKIEKNYLGLTHSILTSVSLLTLTPYKRVPKALEKVTDMANTSKPELKSHQRARDIAISTEDTRTSMTSNNTTTTTTSMRSSTATSTKRKQSTIIEDVEDRESPHGKVLHWVLVFAR